MFSGCRGRGVTLKTTCAEGAKACLASGATSPLSPNTFKKRRSLHLAEDHLQIMIDDVLELLNGGTADTPCGHESAHKDFVTLDSRVVAETHARFAWLQQPPYLFCNVSVPSESQKLVDAWDAMPRHRQHRVTCRDFDE